MPIFSHLSDQTNWQLIFKRCQYWHYLFNLLRHPRPICSVWLFLRLLSENGQTIAILFSSETWKEETLFPPLFCLSASKEIKSGHPGLDAKLGVIKAFSILWREALVSKRGCAEGMWDENSMYLDWPIFSPSFLEIFRWLFDLNGSLPSYTQNLIQLVSIDHKFN